MKVMKYREENRKLYYLDETWLNEGHTKSKVWQDLTITTSREAHRQGLSTGLKAPSGKGRRLIILHIGSEDGFLEGGELVFESKKDGDYHKEMNAKMFEEWFQKIIEKIEPNSVIIMENAPYHSRRIEKIPTMAWTKINITNWLQEKGIAFEASMIKRDLIDLIKPEREKYKQYAVDKLAKDNNIDVLRLPPYHCELNPIEMIWAQVKCHVAGKNSTFKMAELKLLLKEALDAITPAAWQRCIEHVIKEEKKMANFDGLTDNVWDQAIEPLIINLSQNDDDSTISYSSSDNNTSDDD